MKHNIFVNLSVNDLNESMKFWEGLGYSFNPQFSDDTAACLVISENIYAMLLTVDKFGEFTPKEIVDSANATEVILSLSVENKEDVDKWADKAISLGATNFREPDTSYEFMYGRSIEDLDGHVWEILWMDPNYVQ